MSRFQIHGPDHDDGWYESEPHATRAIIVELQRVRRRAINRPLPVLAVAALLTGLVTYRIAHRAPQTEAEVVIAITEGTLADRENEMPTDELVGYVDSVLMPDAALHALIERRNLFPKRKQLGEQFAIESLREQFEIDVYRNSFLYFEEDEAAAQRSVRIGLTVTDTDPDRAFDIARDLAGIVIATSEARSQDVADAVTREVQELRKGLEARLEPITKSLIEKRVALDQAIADHESVIAAGLSIDVAALQHDQTKLQDSLDRVVVSRDMIADRISAAGLASTVQIVEERRPSKPDKPGFLLIMIASIVAVIAVLGSALVVGAFDSRIHDADDVERLGLPILGHVPGFPGDHVGSLRARGAARARVPSFLRWRSHR